VVVVVVVVRPSLVAVALDADHNQHSVVVVVEEAEVAKPYCWNV
jgi:hypothetical protein